MTTILESLGWGLAAGSVLGRDHRLVGKNNHDAYATRVQHTYMLGLVCDGCGSGKHSEVGSKIGARLVAEHLVRELDIVCGSSPEDVVLDNSFCPDCLLETVRISVLDELQFIAKRMGRSFSSTINDYFLFTVVGFILTDTDAVFFSIGDGFVAINGEIISLGPFPNNAPPYLAYGLVDTALKENNPELLRFQIARRLPISELCSFMVGTDGVEDIKAALGKNVPGTINPVGPLSQFWETERFFQNPQLINRRLTLLNKDVVRPDWDVRSLNSENGLLPDDTTLITGRRRLEEVQ